MRTKKDFRPSVRCASGSKVAYRACGADLPIEFIPGHGADYVMARTVDKFAAEDSRLQHGARQNHRNRLIQPATEIELTIAPSPAPLRRAGDDPVGDSKNPVSV